LLNKKTNNKISKITKKTNKLVSSNPPVLILQEDFPFKGQKGLIPSLVKESANKCKEYARKNGREAGGYKNAATTDAKKQKVKECKNPLCLVKN
jgi:hypothetical protein